MAGKGYIKPMLEEVAALKMERDTLGQELTATRNNANFYREALELMRCNLRDKIAMAALTGMLSHGTHHTPEKVMVMVYEFAEAGMKVRSPSERERMERAGILPCQMPNGHGSDEERERCADIALAERVSGETGTAEDAAYNRACEDVAAAIRSGK